MRDAYGVGKCVGHWMEGVRIGWKVSGEEIRKKIISLRFHRPFFEHLPSKIFHPAEDGVAGEVSHLFIEKYPNEMTPKIM